MTRSILICFAVSALSAAAAVSGCSEDNQSAAVTPSAKGESCTRTGDCKGGLVCISGTCVTGPGGGTDGGKPGPTGSGGSTTTGSGGSGATSTTTPPTPVGGKGESCTRRADCDTGLVCVLQTCTTGGSTPSGQMDGGTAPPLPTLGERGESCQSVRDCAEGLTCFPRPGVGGGICDLEKYGLTPTGKVCGGECATAKDCCELPPNVQIQDPISTTVTAIASCTELVQVLLDGDPTECDVTTPASAKDIPCFYYKTYCDCAASTWACTDNACVYTAKCSKDGNEFNGCPTRTRTGTLTAAATCDTTSDKCQAVATGCKVAADCETEPVFDDQTDTCEVDECTCIASRCYRKCNEDLDCAAHYTCDTKQKVCTPSPACTADAECAASQGDVTAICTKDGKCVVPCTTDHQCAASGVAQGGGTFTARVCGKDGACAPLGCASDAECSSQNGLHTFCVTPAAPAAGAIRSAVTD